MGALEECQNVLQVARTSLDSTLVLTKFPMCELTPANVYAEVRQ